MMRRHSRQWWPVYTCPTHGGDDLCVHQRAEKPALPYPQKPPVWAVVYGFHSGWRYGWILTLTSAMRNDVSSCVLRRRTSFGCAPVLRACAWDYWNCGNSIEFRSADTSSYREVRTVPQPPECWMPATRRGLPNNCYANYVGYFGCLESRRGADIDGECEITTNRPTLGTKCLGHVVCCSAVSLLTPVYW